MRYSVQNSFGEVYGMYPMPKGRVFSPEEWKEMLGTELEGILGFNGVSTIRERVEGRIEDRIVVDINALSGDEEGKVDMVHAAIARLATESEVER